MARVISTTGTYAQKIEKFLGLNESKNGDALLKMGEASEMRNFQVSSEGCLLIRPGTKTVMTLGAGPVRGMWTGRVGGVEHTLAACAGHVWNISGLAIAEDLGELIDDVTQFFGMSGNVYILNGHEYKVWTGEGQMKDVEGYIPVVVTAAKPAGGGTALENYNLLTPYRRQKFSGDGTSKEYHLTEYPIAGIKEATVDGDSVEHTVDLSSGVLTFTQPPGEGLSNVEITYYVSQSSRDLVVKKRYHEFYNGPTDTRVFLYGDGSNIALYSGVDENGVGRADYFPALNELQVGTANSPITALIRHYSRMMAYKPDETYKVEYSTQTLIDGKVISGFYVRPVNRNVGNEAMGQVYLCNNNPISLFSGGVYEWKSAYSTATVDERNASRLSQRVESTLQGFRFSDCVAFDDGWHCEYWIACNGSVVIYNYATDVWYKYTGLPNITAFTIVDNSLYFSTDDGRIINVSSAYRSDDGENIEAYWESGSMDFDYPWKKKWSQEAFIGLRSTGGSGVIVTAKSDVTGEYYQKQIGFGLSGFDDLDFGNFTFLFRATQKAIRARIRVPRFQMYKLVFSSDSNCSTAAITDVVIMTRMPRKVR